MAVLLVLMTFKCIWMYLEEPTLTDNYTSLKSWIQVLGCNVTIGTTITFDWYASLEFEVWVLVVTILMLRYYSQ